MSGGNSRIGAYRHALADRGHDFYETPECATEALIRHMTFHRRLWEPAAGNGAIARVFERAGHTPIKSDLVVRDDLEVRQHDFLNDPHPEWVPPGTPIVTNPPFKDADAFIRKALATAPLVVMLLRWTYAEGAKRSDLIDRHLHYVLLGKERLPMMHRDGWEGKKVGNAGQPFAWFVFTQEPTNGIFTVQRISWRKS